MHLVNQHGKVVFISNGDISKELLEKGEVRKATQDEINHHTLEMQNSAQPGNGSVYYSTVASTPDGYGMSRDLIKSELSKLDISLVENYVGQKVSLLYNYPTPILSLRSDVRLVYTMFESDKIPEDWPELLKMADEVIVPSKWCADVFAKEGVKTTVVPLGYDDSVFKFIDRKVPVESGKPFTFIHYDSLNMRKGFSEVFKAFTEEFDKSDNVRLILKTVHQHSPIPIMKSEYPQIDVVKDHLDPVDLVELLGTADCMVYPSRGEGFGITPLEAMATGLPTMVPNAHGISEYFNSNYMIEIPVAEKCPGLYNRFKGEDVGEMVVCDVEALRKLMRHAYDNQTEMLEMGRAASEYAKKYTYRHTAEQLAAIILKWQAANVIKRNDSKFLQVVQV